MYITPGPPEVYKIKNGSMATLISNGPSGQENAILSINHDNPCTYFEISIWLNRFGLTCIGGGSFEAAEKPQPSLQKALGVVWHAMGSALCVIANGDVSFIKISWINKSANAPILYSEAASIYDSGAGSPPVPNSGDQIAVKLLRKIRHSVEATAICQGDNGRYLLISSKRGLIYKFSWLGLKISEISTDIHHEVFRSWELGSLFSFMKAQCHVYGSKSNESSLSYLATPVLESVEEANRPERKVSNTYLLAEDSSASDSERIISCGYCSALQIHYFVREDGSLSFLQDLESNSEAAVKPRTNFSLGYRGTGQIHLFTLMKPDAAVTDQKNLRRPSIGANGTNSYDAENVPYGGCQPAVSKVTHVCVIQGETAAEYSSIPGADISEDDSALFVLTVLTCHLPSHEPYGECDRYKSHSQHLTGSARSSSTNGNGNGISKVEQRATLSLISVRVRVTAHCNAEQEQTDVLKMEQVSSVILEVSSGSVNSSQSSAANDGPGVSSCCALSGRSHSLVTLHRFGQVSQLVLVTVRGVISCRPVGSLTSELFRIDSNSYSSGVRHTISSVTSSLGRLLIAVTRQSDSQDAISAECWSQVHVIPLLESAESSVFHGPCGDVLVDGAEQRLLAFKMLWNQDPGSVGPGGPGYFSELSVPEGLTQEWAARVRYLSLQSARGKSVSGGVLLIASSVLESSGTEKERSTPSDGAVRGVGSASASAGKGYLAVVVAGRSALRSDPCLWVFNALTRRWRSCDITKGKFEGEGDKVSSSSAAVDRSSMEMGSGLWIDVDLKAANGTHLSGDMLLNRQYSTDSEISNSSRLEYRRATSITQLPSSSMNSPSSSSPVSHPSATQTTSTVLGIAWFGDHSLILLRRAVTTPTSVGSPRVNTSPSQSVFTLEVLSRAPTKESMRSGRPRPAAHRVLPLSLAVPSSFSSGSSQCDFSPRLFEVRHSGHGRKEGSRDGDRVAEWCTVVLCNGWYCIGYSVEMIHSAGSEGVAPDYRVSVMWDICLSDHGLEESESPMKTLYGERNGDSTRAQMSLPVSAISILSPAAGEGPCLLMLDANGAAWRVRSFNCDFISKGPFSSMSTVDRTSLFQSDSKEKASAVQSDETSPQSASSQGSESIVLLHGCHSLNRFGSRICGSGNGSSGSSGTSAISGDYLWMTISENDENSAREGESPFLLIPLEGTHTSATATSRPTPLSMTVGILKGSLITLHRALECLPLSSASSSSSGAMRDLLLTEASGVAVSRISLGYNIFLALLEILSGRKSRSGVPSANASAHVALDGSRTVLVSVMRRFLWTLQDPRHSPVTLRFFVECVELRIKHLLESSTFLSPKKSNRWVRLNSPFGPSNSSNIRTDTFVSGRERYCEIMSALYYCSPPSSSIFCELISRLGRKLEPSLSRRLFPVPLDPRLFAIATHSPLMSHSHRGTPSFTSPSAEAMLPSQGADTVTAEVLSSSSLFRPSDLSLAQQSAPSPGPSPLIVFEHALSTRQLSRSCRLLTLACEDVGGTDSPASASLCLRMVLELLYECLRHLSMPLAVQCFDFCRRLEVMVRLYI